MSASDLDRLKSDIDELFPDLVATRRDFHFLPSIKRKQLVRSL